MKRFPDDRSFAFTILDDTDDATLENVRPIYDFLREIGMKTTKTAWPVSCPEGSSLYFAAETLEDPEYLAFVQDLVEEGYELASHCVTMESSTRERTEKGFAFIDRNFDSFPVLHCNHGQNMENVYWGLDRYQAPLIRMALALARRALYSSAYLGHVEGTPYFWGDLCRERFRYVRNFTFEKLDMSSVPPGRPYQLRSTPYVNYWFTTADAPDVHRFRTLVTRKAVDSMVQRGGYSILSTHLGKGFVRNGVVDEQVREILLYISRQRGWFVPVSQLLDFLLQDADNTYMSSLNQYRLELAHISGRIKEKITSNLRKVF